MLYAFNENFVLPFSHDEVVHGKGSMMEKMPGDPWQKAATLRVLYTFMYVHPGKKLLFMGNEFGEWREWNHDDSLDWDLTRLPLHAGLQRFVRDLNRLYTREASLYEVDFDAAGFAWIDCNDHEASVISLMRRARDSRRLRRCRAELDAGRARRATGSASPSPGSTASSSTATRSCTVAATSATRAACRAEPIASHGHAQSLRLTLPPLAGLVFKRAED